MSSKVKIEGLADAVMKELESFQQTTELGVKMAVRKAANTVKNDIKSGAPVKSGAYAKSWSVKTAKETSHSIEMTVHSRNKYQLAHLLEHGHAKRNGGRTRAQVHIAPAEERGIRELEENIRRSIQHG